MSDSQRVPLEAAVHDIIVKLVSRCNLSCTYCYEYFHVDQSWRSSPVVMAPEIQNITTTRIAEYARIQQLSSLRVILHGGEPLLAGVDEICSFIDDIESKLHASCQLRPYLQTNGTLVNEGTLRKLAMRGFKIGLSLDGVRLDNDKYRRFSNGKGSYHLVAEALHMLSTAPYQDLFAGILAVINLDSDPLQTYSELNRWKPPTIDFLLPNANWQRLPPGKSNPHQDRPYAEWLIPIFDHWYSQVSVLPIIRLFTDLIYTMFGGMGLRSHAGDSPDAFLTVDTDGNYCGSDLLKSSFESAPLLGATVQNSSILDVLRTPKFQPLPLSQFCKACPVVNICGGGTAAHRYSSNGDFDNPSVYCADLRVLIRHISRRIAEDAAIVSAS